MLPLHAVHNEASYPPFGASPDPPFPVAHVIEATIAKCLEKFITLGEQAADGRLPLDQLYPARDALVREAKARRPLHVQEAGNTKARAEADRSKQASGKQPENSPGKGRHPDDYDRFFFF